MKFRHILQILVALSILLSGCSPAEISAGSPRPSGDSAPPVVKTSMGQKTQVQGVIADMQPKPKPSPHPTAPLPAVERFVILMQGFETYLSTGEARKIAKELTATQADGLLSFDDLDPLWAKYLEKTIQIGDRTQKVKSFFSEFTDSDKKDIGKFGDELTKQIPAVAGSLVYLGRCTRTSCYEIFVAMYYATIHFPSGRNWFSVPDNLMSNHPMPEINGRCWDYERLLEILEDQCEGEVKVRYNGGYVQVKWVGKRQFNPDEMWFRNLDPQTAQVITTAAIATGTVILVGVLIVAPETAPVAVPVILYMAQ